MSAISITALSDPVAIVHIPICAATRLSTQLYWTVDDAPAESNEFFNITSNAIEIAIFARTNLVNLHWAELEDEIKISSTWRVFEISSGDQGETNNYDSPHLRHVSAPLSRAGISILYQSSYFTDFLLVKESDFEKASQIFAEQGWHFDPNLSSPRRRSQLLSPITPMSRHSPAPTEPHVTPQLTVLPSPLACVGFSHSIERSTAERVRQLVVWPEQARKSWQRKRLSGPRSVETEPGRPFISYTRTEDGASIVTETRILRWMFGRKQHVDEASEVDDHRQDGERGTVEETTDFQLGGQLAVGYITDTTNLSDSDDDDLPPSRMSTSDGMELSSYGLQTPPLDEDKRFKHLSLPTSPRDTSNAPNILISWTGAKRRSTVSLKSDIEEKVKTWQSLPRVPGPKPDRPSRKRCLQLDLRGVDEEETLPLQAANGNLLDELGSQSHATGPVYHMDKSGLVTRFSDLLNSASIRMLYSSTFHTANVLVEAKDIHRAKRLLQGRENSPVKGYF